MALDGLNADIQVLRTEGTSFKTIGDDFSKAVTTLEKGLTALEKGKTPPWGDDELGENFGIVYEGLRDGMYESMAHLATKLQDVGKALKDMGDNQEATEDFNNALLKQEQSHADAKGAQIQNLASPVSI